MVASLPGTAIARPLTTMKIQRVVRKAQYITGAKLPAIQVLDTRRCQRKALKMIKDSSLRLSLYYRMTSRYQSAKSRAKMLPHNG